MSEEMHTPGPLALKRLRTLTWREEAGFAVSYDAPDITAEQAFYEEMALAGLEKTFETTRLRIPAHLMDKLVPEWRTPDLASEEGKAISDENAAKTARQFLGGLRWNREFGRQAITLPKEQAELARLMLDRLHIDYFMGQKGDKISLAVTPLDLQAAGITLNTSRALQKPDESDRGRGT